MAVVNITLLAALPLILDLYTLSDASRELATQLIFIHDGFAMLLWPLALSLPNALRAANDVKSTMVLSIGSMVCFRIALSYIVGVKMGYGALGVWFAMLVDWLFRAIVYVWRFKQGKWRAWREFDVQSHAAALTTGCFILYNHSSKMLGRERVVCSD